MIRLLVFPVNSFRYEALNGEADGCRGDEPHESDSVREVLPFRVRQAEQQKRKDFQAVKEERNVTKAPISVIESLVIVGAIETRDE